MFADFRQKPPIFGRGQKHNFPKQPFRRLRRKLGRNSPGEGWGREGEKGKKDALKMAGNKGGSWQ